MNEGHYEVFSSNLQYFFKGNQFAVDMCMDIIYVIDLWDDLIDQDKERSGEEISLAFKILFNKLPTNPFYQNHQLQLLPIIMNCILQWEDSNVLQYGDDNDLNKAYMLQTGLYDLFSYVALLIGGYEWVSEIGPTIRRSYGEKLNEYKEEHTHA